MPPICFRSKRRPRRWSFSLRKPLKTPLGYHLILVERARPERRAQFNEVREQLERDYLMERAKMYTDLWLRSLTQQATIKRHVFTTGKEFELKEEEDLPADRFSIPKN